MMKYKLLIPIFLAILLVSTTQAYLLVAEQDECIDILQTCATCTYNNISSIVLPDSTIIIRNVAMEQNNVQYNYTFCNTSDLGEYIINGYGDLEGEQTIWRYAIKVTPNGEDPTTATAFFYIILLIIFLILTTGAVYGVRKTESLWGKYAYVALTYLLSIGISFIAWQMALDYITSNTFIAGFFWIIFLVLMVAFFPFLLVSFLYTIYAMRKIKEIERMIKKGVPYDEAVRRSRRK